MMELHKSAHSKNPSPAKKTYSKPALTTYGRIHRTTQGGGSVGAEGMSGMGMMMGGGGGMMMSDRALKQNITRIGTHPFAFGLYLFRYKPEFSERCGTGVHFGVMADEVEKVMPSAVLPGFDGYKAVNYTKIGISFPA